MTVAAGSTGCGPLDGIEVVDFSQAAAGPFCAQHLGDLGASVVKVEPPEGDMIRGWHEHGHRGLGTYFMGLNRNKKSILLDLKDDRGRGVARRLCRRADVVLENSRPGKLAQLGLGYDDVRAMNPSVVYTSISAFGEHGPLRDKPGMDIVVQAFAGLMGITGVEGGEPVKVGAPVADLATGYAAAMATVAALFHRERSGQGQRVRLSMMNVVVSLMSNHTTGHLLHGTPVGRLGSAHPQLVPYQAFQTRDGEYIVVGVLNERFWHKFCDAIGRPELADQPQFKTNTGRVASRKDLLAVLEPVLRSRACDDWEDIFARADVPFTRVNSMPALFAHPQVAAEGTVVEVGHLELGPIPVIAQPARFERTPASYRTAPPLPGEHTAEVLQGLGMSATEIERLRAEGVVSGRPGGEERTCD